MVSSPELIVNPFGIGTSDRSSAKLDPKRHSLANSNELIRY
jgi:hypothetical protein